MAKFPNGAIRQNKGHSVKFEIQINNSDIFSVQVCPKYHMEYLNRKSV